MHWMGAFVGGYLVNVAALATLIDTLEDGAEQVREANKTLAAHGQLNMLGNDTLRDEAHEFEETWRYGLEKLDEAAEGVIERLQAAKKNYEALEDAHEGLFDKLYPGSGAGGGGASGSGASETPAGIPGGGFTGGIGGVLSGGPR